MSYKITNFAKVYPTASPEVVSVLKQSERKMQNQRKLKFGKIYINNEEEEVRFIKSREDSLERLGENEVQFSIDTNVEEEAMRNLMIQNLREAMNQLNSEELELIYALFYQGYTEMKYAKKIGLSQKGVNKRKKKILDKLHKKIKV
ncbi:sigma-70 family RNA polymerase sigma factor [Chakrabartyella piscis]|uniref:sigma-70 family RNA polymerase sigma factor n=1 Tax=Chakrabartyella piscis TaxID=2918914 RepID=UPI002958D039|nr:sigma-70 family RNA polymerase sigma factor [Chakrabartyella piscis]